MRVAAAPASVPIVLLALAALVAGCTQGTGAGEAAAEEAAQAVPLRAVQDEETGSISIYREGEEEPIVTQNAGAEHRPFLHPIVAPDGKGLATEYSPGHHPHQTGLYWGFTRVNGEPMDADTLRQWFYRRDKPEEIARAVGRDYFHNPGGDYWRRDSASVVTEAGTEVQWQTVYGMLDADGKAFMTETQNWSMRAEED
ncbi:MAG: PmoA family protein, partial [bacterium]|nr:PmoA family protein [bacterium]